MTYQHQTERADATLACMERIENLLAAILATLVEQRGAPQPRIQLPPAYKGFTVPLRGDKE